MHEIALPAARVELEGCCNWTQVEKIVQFSKKMGFKKIGIANCISFVEHAYVLSGILESHGSDVVLHLADGYYDRLWGPDEPPKLPVAGHVP